MVAKELQLQSDVHRLVRNILLMLLIGSALFGCQAKEGPIGMTLRWRCLGAYGMGVGSVTFEGQRAKNMGPGALGCVKPGISLDHNVWGASEGYMPGDIQGPVPRWVEVDWMVANASYEEKWRELKSRDDKYSPQWMAEVDKVDAETPHHTHRVDLTKVIKAELIEQARKDRQGTQLVLMFTLKADGTFDVEAFAEKWR